MYVWLSKRMNSLLKQRQEDKRKEHPKMKTKIDRQCKTEKRMQGISGQALKWNLYWTQRQQNWHSCKSFNDTNHWGILLKCRFWARDLGRSVVLNLPDDATVAYLRTTVRVGRKRINCKTFLRAEEEDKPLKTERHKTKNRVCNWVLFNKPNQTAFK